jgi:hypothetical protein
MKTTKPNTLNVSRAIKDAVKMCLLGREVNKPRSRRLMFKAADTANEYALSIQKRYGKKNVVVHSHIHVGHRSPFSFRMTDVTIRTGRGSNITISDRSRFRSVPPVLS